LKETTRANEVYLKLFTQNYEEWWEPMHHEGHNKSLAWKVTCDDLASHRLISLCDPRVFVSTSYIEMDERYIESLPHIVTYVLVFPWSNWWHSSTMMHQHQMITTHSGSLVWSIGVSTETLFQNMVPDLSLLYLARPTTCSLSLLISLFFLLVRSLAPWLGVMR
jgi:hypothetical protein